MAPMSSIPSGAIMYGARFDNALGGEVKGVGQNRRMPAVLGGSGDDEEEGVESPARAKRGFLIGLSVGRRRRIRGD